VLELSDRFRNLEVDSRLEIAFEGKPKGFTVPSYSVYNHQSEDGIVIFEVETRVVARHIPPGVEYNDFEIERTDFLNYCFNDPDVKDNFLSRTGDIVPRRISFSTTTAVDSHYHTPRKTGGSSRH
jgi:hypothetical protein